MHAGLNRPDNVLDRGGTEAGEVAAEVVALEGLAPCGRAPVALVFSYEADWHFGIQPHAKGFRWLQLAFEMYSALRRLGLDVDIVAPDADFSGYALVVAPSLPILDDATLDALAASRAVVLFGPRTGSRTREGHIPADLPPGPLQRRLPVKVTRVESLRPGAGPAVEESGRTFAGRLWREALETELPPLATFDDGGTAWTRRESWHYLATWPEAALLDLVIARVALEADLPVAVMEEGVRLRSRGGVRFALNFAPETRRTPAPQGAHYLLGGPDLPPAGLAAWRIAAP
jgi:beta-galactosidase